MALIKCPECNHDVSSAAKACPYCGYPINSVGNSSNQSNTQASGQPALIRFDESEILSTDGVAKHSQNNTQKKSEVNNAISYSPPKPESSNKWIWWLVLVIGIVILVWAIQDKKTSASASYSKSGTTYTTSTSIPTVEPRKSWKKAYYVNDFNEKTSSWYLQGVFYGEFSNSATASSELKAVFFVEHDYSSNFRYDMFRIRLVEYGSNPVNYKTTDTSHIEIKIKIDNRTYTDTPWSLDETEMVICRENKIFEPILQALESGREIKFVIQENKYTTSTYRFTVDSTGIEDIDHTWGLR